jgi:hypothetical protein
MIPDGPIRRDAKRSLDFRAKILTPSSVTTKVEARHFASAALYEITSEHHSSVTLMLLFGRFSSAQALIRPCVEASIRSLWLLRCVTDQQFDDLQKGKDWPGLEQVIGKIEGAVGKGGFLRRLIPERQLLNDLSHGGFSTIADRLYPSASRLYETLPPVEKAREITAAFCIRTCDRMLCLAATGMYSEFRDEQAAATLEREYKSVLSSYELGSFEEQR